jgi:hypothetical protein
MARRTKESAGKHDCFHVAIISALHRGMVLEALVAAIDFGCQGIGELLDKLLQRRILSAEAHDFFYRFLGKKLAKAADNLFSDITHGCTGLS